MVGSLRGSGLSAAIALFLFAAPGSAQATVFGYSTTGDQLVNCVDSAGATAWQPISTPACPSADTLELTSNYSQPAPPGTTSYSSTYWGEFAHDVLPSGSSLRFWIPYDALRSWNTSTKACGPSPSSATTSGEHLYDRMIWGVQYAIAHGWMVDIQVEGANSDQTSAIPFFPQPFYGNSTSYNAGWTTGGHDYDCGVQGLFDNLLGDVPGLQGSQVQWEVMNEPDAARNPRVPPLLSPGTSCDSSNQSVWPCSAYRSYCASGSTVCDGSDPNACPDLSVQPGADQIDGCGTPPAGVSYNHNGSLCGSTSFQQCGALEAAELWEIARQDNTEGYRIAALTSDYPHTQYSSDQGFNYDYIQEINALQVVNGSCSGGSHYTTANCWAQYPTYWSVHDYNDPTTYPGNQELQWLENMLSANLPSGAPQAHVWVTESGVWLNDWNTYDDVYPNGPPCHGDDSSTDPTDPSTSQKLGCLMDNSELAQEFGAESWQSLATVSAANVTTSQVYWFQFAATSSGWDSALKGGGGTTPRGAYCYLVQSYTGSCGAADEYLSSTNS